MNQLVGRADCDIAEPKPVFGPSEQGDDRRLLKRTPQMARQFPDDICPRCRDQNTTIRRECPFDPRKQHRCFTGTANGMDEQPFPLIDRPDDCLGNPLLIDRQVQFCMTVGTDGIKRTRIRDETVARPQFAENQTVPAIITAFAACTWSPGR